VLPLRAEQHEVCRRRVLEASNVAGNALAAAHPMSERIAHALDADEMLKPNTTERSRPPPCEAFGVVVKRRVSREATGRLTPMATKILPRFFISPALLQTPRSAPCRLLFYLPAIPLRRSRN